MIIKKAKAAIYLDKSHPKKNSECSIYIRITYNRTRKYYPTSYSLTPKDFEKVVSEKPGTKLEATAHSLMLSKIEAQTIINNLPNFSFELFEKRFISNRTTNDSLSVFFEATIKGLKANEQIGTAISYECAKNSIDVFRPELKLSDVTISFLQAYEKWMLENGRSTTTISIYLRHLRTIFNSAIEDGLIAKELYPFGKRRYEIPQSNNVKKALTLKEVGLIYHYQAAKGSTAERAKSYWLFMYFSNGMNVKDMAKLKYENIKGNVIEFQRSKTARTKRTYELIRVALIPEIETIIHQFGNKNRKPENYIFPILTKGITPTRERQLIQQVTSVINDHIKDIANNKLKIAQHVTTYTCRHSFATILQRSGISIEFISEALGHSNIRTTQNYLAGFEDDKKYEVAKVLSSFK